MEIVRENINFERGKDPKAALEIGMVTKAEDAIEKFLSIEHKRKNAIGSIKIYPDKTLEMSFNTFFDPYNAEYIRRILKISGLDQYLIKPVFSFQEDINHIVLTWRIKPQYGSAFKNGSYDLYALFTEKGYEIRHRKFGAVEESQNFERGIDPKEAMGIGKVKLINDWMGQVITIDHSKAAPIGIKNYKINKDFSIDTDLDVIAVERPELFPNGRFPDYIRFNSSGSFDIDDCGIVSLVGCPKKVNGYFSCQMNEITNLKGFPKEVREVVYCFGNEARFTKEEIMEVCVAGGIQTDDSDE